LNKLRVPMRKIGEKRADIVGRPFED